MFDLANIIGEYYIIFVCSRNKRYLNSSKLRRSIIHAETVNSENNGSGATNPIRYARFALFTFLSLILLHLRCIMK